mgnify:CR=1 FL=1
MSRHCYVNEKNPLYITGEKINIHNQYSLIVKVELCILPIVILLFASTFFPVFSNAKSSELAQSPINDKQQILGTAAEVTPSSTPITAPSPSPTLIPSPAHSPTPEPTISPSKTYAKKSYSIAVYGDSMVDTMGERLEYLEHSLKRIYPNVNFTLYNYGIGAQHVETGLGRWFSRLDYQDRHYPSIVEVKPDIIVIGSFAYNPFSPYNRDRHWLGLTKLVQQAQTLSPNVYMLAEIIPLRSNFGKGPMGVNYDTDTAYTHSGWIVEQLENVVGLSRTLNTPLINVFHQSIGRSGLTNPSDGIHPSVAGHEFTADIIANTIQLN